MLKSQTETAPFVAVHAPDAAPVEADNLLDLEAVCRFFGGSKPLHPSTIYRMIDAGRCPRPGRPCPNTNRWLLSECKAALREIVKVPREPLQSPKTRAKHVVAG
jgi:predicted DNA-binding transcriptional regulator AlpA